MNKSRLILRQMPAVWILPLIFVVMLYKEAEAEINLLRNPGFEEGVIGESPPIFWKLHYPSVHPVTDDKKVHSGYNSVCVQVPPKKRAFCNQSFRIVENTSFKFSVWHYVEEITDLELYYQVKWRGPDIEVLTGSAAANGTGKWTYTEFVLTAPAGAVKGELLIMAKNKGTSGDKEIWFDDVEVSRKEISDYTPPSAHPNDGKNSPNKAKVRSSTITTGDADLPPLLMFSDGTPVRTMKDWRKRREEIRQLMIKTFVGTFPRQVPAIIRTEVLEEYKTQDGSTRRRVKLTFATPNKASFEMHNPINTQESKQSEEGK